jgi:hypothetical protein
MPSARNGHQKTGSELSLINSQRQDGDRTLWRSSGDYVSVLAGIERDYAKKEVKLLDY